MKEKEITQESVRALFDYHDGNLIRRTRQARCVKVGDIAGSVRTDGYVCTKIDGKQYRNHRIIWLWHFGYFPEYGLDHIDRDKLNNRIENLREVSQSCNLRNSKQQAGTTSGVKGVSHYKPSNKWHACIKANGKLIYLGRFDDFMEAVCHRLAAEQAENWEGCDSSSPAYQYVMKTINLPSK